MSVRLAAAALLALAPTLGAQQQPAAPRPGPQQQAAPDTTMRIDYRREIYNYQGGSRDPFLSLVTSTDVGPSIVDLRLVSVVFDARGGRSVAVVRQANNPRPYRLRRGDQIGRLRVLQIRQYEVVFQVEEFGFERQETLRLTRPEADR